MTICSNHPDPWIRKRANDLMREAGLDVYDPTELIPFDDAQFAQKAKQAWRKQAMFFRLSLCALVASVLLLAGLLLTTPQKKVVFVVDEVVAPNGRPISASQGQQVIPRGSFIHGHYENRPAPN